MPLGTLDRTAPPLFNQGQSALSKLIFFGALALFLMVADARLHLVQPLRAAVGAVLYPVQWLALKPVQLVVGGGRYLEDLQTAQRNENEARKALMLQAERASQADTLAQDNARLRALLELRQTTQAPRPRGRGALRRGRPVHAQDRHRPGAHARRGAGLARDRRARRARRR